MPVLPKTPRLFFSLFLFTTSDSYVQARVKLDVEDKKRLEKEAAAALKQQEKLAKQEQAK